MIKETNRSITTETIGVSKEVAEKTVFPILLTISFSHLLNDTLQSLIPSIYPMVKDTYALSFSQVGLITLTFQLAASLLQPVVGFYTDKKPQPFSLAIGMALTLTGLIVLAVNHSYQILLVSVALIGLGSSVFHPEASKVAYMASGGRRGLAQSIFQVGGNAGSALGPLLAAAIIIPYGQTSILWFSLLALLAITLLIVVGKWYSRNMHRIISKSGVSAKAGPVLSRGRVTGAVVILLVLIFSKYFYLACISSYYTFYLIDKFQVSVQNSQVYLFVFLFAVAAGTLLGGPLGDRFGRKYIIWFSILGAAPFTLLLPYVSLFWTCVLTVFIGFILASAFSAILVYAQELIPGKVGTVAGLFFGFAFGMGGLGSALLGILADHTSIQNVFRVCAFLPLIGLLTGFLPNIGGSKK
ncbi:MFS transporter [Segetibacter sp.]|uniref:MFS transporter n=1 Tax=Segetibacter sp. TaxID=2231182 RepID=UPI002604467A|nr:MFS transporter [Segetibacter sp.]MCW3081795.1 transporter [Segetibacter sp.]